MTITAHYSLLTTHYSLGATDEWKQWKYARKTMPQGDLSDAVIEEFAALLHEVSTQELTGWLKQHRGCGEDGAGMSEATFDVITDQLIKKSAESGWWPGDENLKRDSSKESGFKNVLPYKIAGRLTNKWKTNPYTEIWATPIQAARAWQVKAAELPGQAAPKQPKDAEPAWQYDGHEWIGSHVDPYLVRHDNPEHDAENNYESWQVGGRKMTGQLLFMLIADLWFACRSNHCIRPR